MNGSLALYAALISGALGTVLVLRRPLRWVFGASASFLLWALVPVSLAGLLLPTPSWVVQAPVMQALAEQSHHLSVATRTAAPPIWGLLWLMGTTLMLARLALSHWFAWRRHRPVPATLAHAVAPLLDGLPATRLGLGPDAAVSGVVRARLLLPADFLDRFDATERACILRHELAHLRRGDPYWVTLAELLLALCWWQPLAWFALPRFRLDLELACDERCLRAVPEQRGLYARTLLHSAGLAPAPAIIPWFHSPQLKERLLMIHRVSENLLRRRLGFIAIGLLLVGSAFVVQAATQAVQPATADTEWNLHNAAPTYPADALKNKESGLVWMIVLVGKDGLAKHVEIDHEHSTTQSPSLLKAATDVAMRWHFRPTLKNGKPVEGYARVPVQFDLTPTAAQASSKS